MNFKLSNISNGQVLTPQTVGNTGANNPLKGPVGSIYQPAAYMPKDERNGFISMGPIPPASNFKSQRFPARVWNTVANFGNPLDIFKPRQEQ